MGARRGFTCVLHAVITGLLLYSAASNAAAQRLADGLKVRVFEEGSARITGTVQRTSRDTLWYWTGESIHAAAMPLESVVRIDVREPAGRGYGAWKWTKRAFVAGAMVGAITCFVGPESCKSRPDEGTLEAALASAVFLGVGVAPVGALGGAIFPGHRWRTLPPPYTTALDSPSSSMPGMRLVIRL